MKNDAYPLDEAKAITAVLALLTADREERLSGGSSVRKTELILASAGLTPAEIAPLVGKRYDAVTKTIQRAKAPGHTPT
jgi:DNA-directed RNA polymerase specialized sigma24 family protein